MEPTVTMERVLEPSNLNEALRVVRANGGAPGVDGMRTEALAGHLREHWPVIEEKVRAGRYKPAPVKRVWIEKPGGGERPLGIPSVMDRFLQQALAQSLTAVFDPKMSEHSYGFRPGRSAHQAVEAARAYVRAGKSWVVDIDLKSFFDEVDHARVLRCVAAEVSDGAILRLIGRFLRAGVYENGQRTPTSKGVPQGGPLSPLLANLYLDALDKELENRGLSFCRYADDCNIYVGSEKAAARVFESVVKWIEKHLKIPVNRDKSDIGRPWERQFLGYQITERHELKPAPKSLARLRERVKRHFDWRRPLTSTELRDEWQSYIRGWCAYYRLAEHPFWREDISRWIRRRIRCCFWQRWHDAQGRRNALERMGVSEKVLRRPPLWGAAWPMSKHPAMHTALNNKCLESTGFWTPSRWAPASG